MTESLEKEWEKQVEDEEQLAFKEEITEMAQNQPTKIMVNASEHSYIGFNSRFRRAIMELISNRKHYQISKIKFWQEKKVGLFSRKPYYKIWGMYVQWKSGKITLVRGIPGRYHSHITISKEEWNRWWHIILEPKEAV